MRTTSLTLATVLLLATNAWATPSRGVPSPHFSGAKALRAYAELQDVLGFFILEPAAQRKLADVALDLDRELKWLTFPAGVTAQVKTDTPMETKVVYKLATEEGTTTRKVTVTIKRRDGHSLAAKVALAGQPTLVLGRRTAYNPLGAALRALAIGVATGSLAKAREEYRALRATTAQITRGQEVIGRFVTPRPSVSGARR